MPKIKIKLSKINKSSVRNGKFKRRNCLWSPTQHKLAKQQTLRFLDIQEYDKPLLFLYRANKIWKENVRMFNRLRDIDFRK